MLVPIVPTNTVCEGNARGALSIIWRGRRALAGGDRSPAGSVGMPRESSRLLELAVLELGHPHHASPADALHRDELPLGDPAGPRRLYAVERRHGPEDRVAAHELQDRPPAVVLLDRHDGAGHPEL